MSRRDSVVRLRHMLDHAKEAVAMAKGKTHADLTPLKFSTNTVRPDHRMVAHAAFLTIARRIMPEEEG